jgi:hypothetical protein
MFYTITDPSTGFEYGTYCKAAEAEEHADELHQLWFDSREGGVGYAEVVPSETSTSHALDCPAWLHDTEACVCGFSAQLEAEAPSMVRVA